VVQGTHTDGYIDILIYIIAFKHFEGFVIIKSKPFVASLSSQHLQTSCSSCFSSSATKQCTQCRVVRYCDAVCVSIFPTTEVATRVDRAAKRTTGPFTNTNVLLFKHGLRNLRLQTLPFRAMPFDASVECSGKCRKEVLTVSLYVILIVSL
jgi:hypothetical protein